MSVDYIVASLPALAFGSPAPLKWEAFLSRCGGELEFSAEWRDLEAELRNALAEARQSGNAKWRRPVNGCRLYWRGRVAACFQEHDVLKREELLDRVWWDAAGELTPPTAPLGRGALETYALRLKIALKRDRISRDAGNAAFDRLTAETRK